MKSQVLRICLWYGYLAALGATLMDVGVEYTWGRRDVMELVVPALLISAFGLLIRTPPRAVDPERRSQPVDGVGLGGVVLAILGIGLAFDDSRFDITSGARFFISSSMMCVGGTATIVAAVLRVRASTRDITTTAASEAALKEPKIL